jgi:WS/DGAT/MGAT family acyltransferase
MSTRMSGADIAWLRMERPTNPMVITAVLLFNSRLSLARLKQTLRSRFLAFERFRQRPVERASGFYWQEDKKFDLDRHVHRVALPAPGDKRELEALVSDLASTPLDPAQPMWQFYIVEGYLRGRSALVVRMHHCYADGAALMRVLLALTEGGSSLPKRRTGAAGWEAWLPWLEPLAKAGAGVLFEVLLHPSKALGFVQAGASALAEAAKLLAMSPEPKTRFRGTLGTSKRVAWCDPLPLAKVKALGKALGCTVNDVLLSAAAGALGAYLASHHDRVQGLEIRVVVPVNLRRADSEEPLGNEFGLVFLELPLGVANPIARVHAVRARMLALRSSPQPVLMLGLLGFAGQAPRAVQEQLLEVLGAHATAVMTNVPGPRTRLRFAGAEIVQQMFWVPQAGDIAMGASILSYAGHVQFGLITDAGLVRDPEQIVARFPGEIEKLQEAVA